MEIIPSNITIKLNSEDLWQLSFWIKQSLRGNNEIY